MTVNSSVVSATQTTIRSSEARQLASPSPRRIESAGWWAILLICGCYYLLGNEWSWPLREVEGFTEDPAALATQAEEGRDIWRFAFLGIGIIGGGLLVLGRRLRPRWDSALGLAMLAVIAWSMASLLWSDDPLLTARRIVTLICVFVGALGFGGRFSVFHTIVLAFTFSSIVLLLSIACEISHGTLAPLTQGYRFAGTYHPNQQAVNLCILILSSVALAKFVPAHRWAFFLIAAIAAVFLVMTRSRTAVATVLIGLAAWWYIQTHSTNKWLMFLAFVTIVGIAAAGLLLLGWDDPVALENAALLGRADEGHESFTGRIPLWTMLWDEWTERPWLGYGYNSYWTDERTENAHHELQWAVPHAHNAYLETLLSTGLIGFLLTMAVVVLGIRALMNRDRLRRVPEYGFLFALTIFGVTHGLLESQISVPFSFHPFVIGCGLTRIAYFNDPAPMAGLD